MLLLLWWSLSSAWSAPLEDVLVSELERAMTTLAGRDEKPHYAAVQVEERQELSLTARDGALANQGDRHQRWLDVDLRVGTPELDSTHQLRGFSALESDERGQIPFPIDDGEAALRHAVWKALDQSYREGAERVVIVRANLSVKVEEEDPAPDFLPVTTPVVDRREVPAIDLDRAAWSERIVRVAETLDADPAVHQSTVSLQGTRVVKTFVDSAGSRIVHGSTLLRVSLMVSATASDGDVVTVYESRDTHDVTGLPTEEELDRWASFATERLAGLVAAPRGEPFSGPVILAGRAAGVFFHEVLGHRVEGHRQKRDDEGKTFADHVGRSVLPAFVDVYDDPTIEERVGTDLNGHYAYDDEGTPAGRARIVEDGVFVGFLMGRSPIPGFVESNGHGRRMAGRPPVARMGNTIVEASATVPFEELKEMLREEARAQGLPYGILVEEIDGGFTLTGREMPNAFNVRASASWRVYADGRPDELVRGIDLVGTPLVAFGNLLAASDSPEVFNGYCGAESGWVPVSAVAPALLFKKLEFQLKEKEQERPPLLTKPTPDLDGSAEVTP